MSRFFYLLLLFLTVHTFMNAQSFSFEYGRLISIFDYKNSEGEKLDNLQGTTNNHFALTYKMPIRRSKFFFLSDIAYNQYGAIGSDALVGNFYEWKVNYVGLNVGAGYEFFKLDSYLNYQNVNTDQGFTFYIQASAAFEYLVQGTQTINNTTYNLIGVEQFDKPFVFAKGGIGVTYYASKTLSVYLQYVGGMGFNVFKSKTDKEDLRYITHTISFGVAISLPKHK